MLARVLLSFIPLVLLTVVSSPTEISTAQGEAPSESAPVREGKFPVPTAEKLQEVRETIRQGYVTAYEAAASKKKKRSELARTLIGDASSPGFDAQPASRYGLLMEAYDLAIRGADLASAFAAIEPLDQQYEPVDALAMRVTAAVSIFETKLVVEDKAFMANSALDLVQDCLDVWDVERAGQVLGSVRKLAKSLAKRTDNEELKLRLKTSKELLGLVTQVVDALQTLKETPDDSVANSTVGQYYTFTQGDFEQGCPFLAKGAPSDLTECARLDETLPSEVDDRATLARMWGAWSQGKRSAAKTQAKQRAVHWFGLAIENAPELKKNPLKRERDALLAELDSLPALVTAQPGKQSSKSKGRGKSNTGVKGNLTIDLRRAVSTGVEWLLNHQSEEGSWDCDRFAMECGCHGLGKPVHSVGTTGLVLLALLNVGTPYGEQPVDQAITRGMEWLRAQQDASTGLFGEKVGHAFMYNHGIALYSLATALKQAPDSEVEEWTGVCQKAVNFVNRSRNPGSAWRYNSPPNGQNDTCVTVWMVKALKATEQIGLQSDSEAYLGAVGWIDQVTEPASGRTGYDAVGSPSARISGINAHFESGKGECMTAAALIARARLGQNAKSNPIMEKGVKLLLAKLPEWEPDEEAYANDMLYWFYGTEALYELRTKRAKTWKAWRLAVKKALLDSQSEDGHEAGSWSPIGPWGFAGGRVYSTALGVLTLSREAR